MKTAAMSILLSNP